MRKPVGKKAVDTNGFDDFKQILANFNWLSVWVGTASAAVPFVASLLKFAPPWPSGIVPSTALIQLVGLVLVYQLIDTAKRRVVNIAVSISIVFLAFFSTLYLLSFSLFVYQIETTGELFVGGFSCTLPAAAQFPDCPFLDDNAVSSAGYEQGRLWTRPSIAYARLLLVSLWSAAFLSLSIFLGAFLTYQGNRRVRRRSNSDPS